MLRSDTSEGLATLHMLAGPDLAASLDDAVATIDGLAGAVEGCGRPQVADLDLDGLPDLLALGSEALALRYGPLQGAQVLEDDADLLLVHEGERPCGFQAAPELAAERYPSLVIGTPGSQQAAAKLLPPPAI